MLKVIRPEAGKDQQVFDPESERFFDFRQFPFEKKTSFLAGRPKGNSQVIKMISGMYPLQGLPRFRLIVYPHYLALTVGIFSSTACL